MDLWEIVDESEEAPPSDANPKVIKEYQRRVNKAMSTIGINLVDSQLHHIKSVRNYCTPSPLRYALTIKTWLQVELLCSVV
jgi:hypothetical protein